MNKYFEENKENMIRQLDIWAYRIQHIAYCLQLEKWRKTHKTPMKDIWNSLKVKPEWLTMEQIEAWEKEMED